MLIAINKSVKTSPVHIIMILPKQMLIPVFSGYLCTRIHECV